MDLALVDWFCCMVWRFTVVSIQVDSIQIEVVSRHHRSRFDTCRKSIRFNSIFRPVAGGEAWGPRASLPEIFRFELNSATKLEFCLLKWTAVHGSYSFQVLSTIERLCTVVLLCNWNCVKERNRIFALPKTMWALKYLLIFHQNRQKQNGSKCTNELGIFWFAKRSASVKYTTVARVKLRLFGIYIEGLTMSSQEPPKKSPNEITDYFVCTANAHAWVSCILCQDTQARTIWKNTRFIMALNRE